MYTSDEWQTLIEISNYSLLPCLNAFYRVILSNRQWNLCLFSDYVHRTYWHSLQPMWYFVGEFASCLSLSRCYPEVWVAKGEISETQNHDEKGLCFFDKQDFRPLSHTDDSRAQNTTDQVRCNWIIGYSVNTNGFPTSISRFDNWAELGKTCPFFVFRRVSYRSWKSRRVPLACIWRCTGK